jgi:hypothetical protein
MSMRTIIEINHDLGHMIDNRPDDFLDALQALLSSANQNTAAALGRFGFRVVETVHHSTDRKVVIMGEDYPL